MIPLTIEEAAKLYRPYYYCPICRFNYVGIDNCDLHPNQGTGY